MANMKITDAATITTMANSDTVFVNSGSDLKQIALSSMNAISTLSHNIPRLEPKDITSYYEDGSLWKRLNGSDGYSLFEDIFVGDYIKMSRAISAKKSGFYISGNRFTVRHDCKHQWTDGEWRYWCIIQPPGNGPWHRTWRNATLRAKLHEFVTRYNRRI